jgi:hypothetical protein
MAAPLNTCSTIEQRGVVRFLWTKGMATKDIHKELLDLLIDMYMSYNYMLKDILYFE